MVEMNEAARVTVEAMTRYLGEGKPEDAFECLEGQSPGDVIEFLLGMWVATISDLCEVFELTPIEYMQTIAPQLHQDAYS